MTKVTRYIVAVSGGIDSVCLLHMLIHKDRRVADAIPDGAEFVVAHVNHGIRPHDADRDEKFVRKLAQNYGLEFLSTRLRLGEDASEESARSARYDYLDSMVEKCHAQGIILAHHRQDVLETAIINTIRGSGRRGMASLRSTTRRTRPLLSLSKKEIQDYAGEFGLHWVEDKSNLEPKYLRNRIRLAIGGKDEDDHTQALRQLAEISSKNDQLDKEIATVLQYKLRDTAIVSRLWFVKLPHIVASELIHALLGKIGVNNIDRELVERVVVVCKVARPGTSVDIDKETVALVTKRSVRFVDRTTLKARRL